MLYGLAKDDNAPKTFAKLNKNSTPSMALLMSSVVVGITIVLNYVMPEGVFSLISGISTVCFLFIWAIIVICHMKFLKQTKDEDRPKFRLKGAKVINILSLIFLALIIVICAVLESTRIALFITPIWFIALLIIYQVKFKEQ